MLNFTVFVGDSISPAVLCICAQGKSRHREVDLGITYNVNLKGLSKNFPLFLLELTLALSIHVYGGATRYICVRNGLGVIGYKLQGV